MTETERLKAVNAFLTRIRSKVHSTERVRSWLHALFAIDLGETSRVAFALIRDLSRTIFGEIAEVSWLYGHENSEQAATARQVRTQIRDTIVDVYDLSTDGEYYR